MHVLYIALLKQVMFKNQYTNICASDVKVYADASAFQEQLKRFWE